MYQQYQKARLVLENHKEYSSDVLESLAFLEKERLIHSEWKDFSLEIISQFISLLPLLPLEDYHEQEAFLHIDSVTELCELLDSFDMNNVRHITLYESHNTVLREIILQMNMTKEMQKELNLYDEIITKRASEKVKRFMDQSLEIFHEPSQVVSIVLEWYQESNLKFQSAEAKK